MADDKKNNLDKIQIMMEEIYSGSFNGIHYQYLDEKIAKFKNEFDFPKIIQQLKNEITKLCSDEEEVFSHAKAAINRLSTFTLHTQSLFSSECRNEETCTIEFTENNLGILSYKN